MFESLSDRLQGVFSHLRGKGRLSEKDVAAATREIRLALLEADVNFKVVKDFVARVQERAVGEEVMSSLTPGQQVVKIVHEELAALLGEDSQSRLQHAAKPPLVILLVGLQGSGKTTTAAKLALHLKKQGKNPLLVAADQARPAAAEQLTKLGEGIGVDVYREAGVSPVAVVANGLRQAVRQGRDVVILDSAGRLHADEDLMEELVAIHQAADPQETLLVVDAMTGQDAVTVAEGFAHRISLTGTILTKLDGDARGGAALSVRSVTGQPVKFVGVGERPDALEPFHPERMASRILGMGDVLTLIEKAEATIDRDKAADLERKLRQNEFTLQDFLDQMREVRKMGSFDQILGMIPGASAMKAQLKGARPDEGEWRRVESVILSMTKEERRRPQIVDGSRKRRIARGAGVSTSDVNRCLKQFDDVRRMMSTFARPGKRGRAGLMPGRRPF